MEKKNIITAAIFILLCALIAYSFSTDKPTAALTVITLALAAFTAIISADTAQKTHEQTERAIKLSEKSSEKTHKQTERSLKLTELALEKSVIEQRMSAIQESIDKFYYPLNDHLIYGPSNIKWNPETFDKIGFHRYLAKERTNKQFELFKIETNYSHGRPATDLLTQYVKEDVDKLEKEFNNLQQKLDTLETEYKKLKESYTLRE